MEISKKYDPAKVEDKWYAEWIKNECFKSIPNEKPAYTIVIPPPNVTGVLHMGHMLNNTIQDILIRRARMQGFNACWVPGTDHASIATEAKVVKQLADEGVSKFDIGREKFLEKAFEWKEKYGGIILRQLRKLGVSADWDRTRFTMEEKLSEAVIDVFVDLYDKGLIYRGARMVNWDPKGKTAVSDEEVIYKEENSQLYFINYKLKDSDEHLTIATTRPETIMGDTALAVNPDDERYKKHIGKKVLVPLVNREIEIIADDYVTMDFGTGCLKITPAHDPNDHEIGLRHGLESRDILNDDGTLNQLAELYVGDDRFVARKKIVKDLKTADQLEKTEDYMHKVGLSERTHAVIEPKISTQWFVKMRRFADKAMEVVRDGEVKFHPSRFDKTYFSWLENIHNWCISRQLWWGQRIPAWYLSNGEFVVAKNETEALAKAKEKYGDHLQSEDLKQDPDVVDTWFSSWLWPISVFDGFTEEGKKELAYYYPTNIIVTGHDIIFFWVARMIMAGYEYIGKAPFTDVYFTGMVRDKQRRKMSKQLGNSPDALELISKFGADGTRMGLLLSSPAGNDLLFDENLCEQGRNFCNKIWNAYRLIQGWETVERQANENSAAEKWIDNRFYQTMGSCEKSYETFRLSEVVMALYNFVWSDFCSSFLEMVKPARDQKINSATKSFSLDLMERILKMLHPFTPFISEEIWQNLSERKDVEFLCLAEYPVQKEFDTGYLKKSGKILSLITEIRANRNKKQVAGNEMLPVWINASKDGIYKEFEEVLKKLAKISDINYTSEHPDEQVIKIIIDTDEVFLGLGNSLDVDAEKARLEEEIKYHEGFKTSVEKKLSNTRFVNNAPSQVVENEKKKLEDSLIRINSLREALEQLA